MAEDSDLTVVIWAISIIAIPSVAILGIVGSSLSMIILYGRGLRKTSDLLLFLLAVVDAVSLVQATVLQIYGFHGKTKHESNGATFFLIVLWVMGDTCLYCSLGLPVIITAERIFAIFRPFNFDRILTKRKTLVIMAVMFSMYASMRICIRCSDVSYRPLPTSNLTTVWYITVTTYQIQFDGFITVIKGLDNQLSGSIPLVIVVTGTVVIGVKVKLASINRQKLLSTAQNEAATSKTTRTLLSVCAVYSVINGFATLNIQFNTWTSQTENIVGLLGWLLLCVNSFCNFIIYVVTNPKFRLSAVYKRASRK